MIELIPNEWRYRDAETKQILPWYTKPVVEMLIGMDLNDKRVFEYGVGDSTAWYRSRSAKCYGVESDKGWAEKCGVIWHNMIYPKGDYLSAIQGGKDFMFDIICIDGDYRDYCLAYAIQCIKEDGFIIIDNFEQPSADLPDWPDTRKLINDLNLKLEIYKESGHQDWQTAIIRL